MAIVTSSGFDHVRLTVTDIRRSKEFYDRVFGWPVVIDASDQIDKPGTRQSPDRFYGGVVYQTPSGAFFGLRPVGTQRFDPDHTGLDHISFMVGSREDLVDAQRALQDAGVEHGEIKDLAEVGHTILSFSDPDGIHLELTAHLG